jgi:hypothetical protein
MRRNSVFYVSRLSESEEKKIHLVPVQISIGKKY